MVRLIVFFVAVVALTAGLAYLADRPGELVVNWQGYEITTSVFRAIVIICLLIALVMVLWSLLRQLLASPGAIGRMFRRRRERRGLDALSSGMIAVGAGDRSLAVRSADQARRSLPNEPLTELLRAQTAQLTGDRVTARRVFEAMLSTPETQLLGLRGLFLEAQREKETEAARQFAERAMKLNPALGWSANALFELQCKASDWARALQTLTAMRKHGHIDKKTGERYRAVLLTAQAMELEDSDMDNALTHALEAHKLAPDLVPAAEIAGRLLASRGNTSKASSILVKTWKRAPHPDIAHAYAFARPGDSPRDRLRRVKELAAHTPFNPEAPIAVANAAIEAKEWQTAREAIEPLLEKRQTQRVCALMARIDGEQHGDRGRVREWLARAVQAPRDPAWTADGYVSEHWSPISPITGKLDAFEWKVPVEPLEKPKDMPALDGLRSLDGGALAAAEPARLVDAETVGEAGAPANGESGASSASAPSPSAPSPSTPAPSAPPPALDVEIAAPEAVAAREPAGGDVDVGELPPGLETDERGTGAPSDKDGQGAVAADRPADRKREVASGQPSGTEKDAPVDLPKATGEKNQNEESLRPAASTPVVPQTAAARVSDGAKTKRAKRGGKPRIFVPPRAPDDPGPEPMDPDEASTPLARFRIPPMKGQTS